MFEPVPLISLIFFRFLRCSIVIDSLSQNGIHVSDFCPKMEHCEEGTHVMCMYYDPSRIMGPRCNKPKNVSITPALAEKLLEVTNAIRSKVALGKEKGKNGNLLPRGYGMFRLQWDSELATFAQVLANQCVLRHDICRATKRFSDPGQTAGLVRFSYPDWFPVTNAAKFTKAGLTVSKLDYAITQSLKSWYNHKNAITPDMITNFPDWEKSPQLSIGRLYLEMISGPATHMGCGISAYMEYAYYDNNAPLNYNSIQVICNYSARPRKGGSVYEVSPPSDVGYTIKCGCPPGTEEDSDCLCYDSPRKKITDPATRPSCSGSGRNCNPAVVLLPIFTIEDAPLEKLVGHTKADEMEEEIMDYYSPNETTFQAARIEEQNIHSVLNNRIKAAQPKYQMSTRPRQPIVRDVKDRFFDKKSHMAKIPYQLKTSHSAHVKKQRSIFSRVPTFVLHKKENSTFKPDVQPRRDFSKVQNIVKHYLNFRKNRFGLMSNTETTTSIYHHRQLNLNSAEDEVMSYSNNNVHNNSVVGNKRLGNFATETSRHKSHDSVMNLLDKLEEEVKHIDLDVKKKELFDAKIRKIYGTVVGKPVDLRHKYSEKYDTDLTDYETDIDKYGSDQRQSDTEFEYLDEKVKNLHNKIEGVENYDKNRDRYFVEKHKRPLNNNRNSIAINEISDKEHKSNTKPKSHLNSLYTSDYDKKKDSQKGVLSDDDAIKFRHIFSDKEAKSRSTFSGLGERRRLNDITDKKKPLDHDNYNDILSIDRRKYYQEKLDNLEKKLHSSHYKHHKDRADRHLRPVLPTTREEEPLRPGKTHLDPFYLPDRARFLHGF